MNKFFKPNFGMLLVFMSGVLTGLTVITELKYDTILIILALISLFIAKKIINKESGKDEENTT